MTLEDFHSLPQSSRFAFVVEFGSFLTVRRFDAGRRSELYWIDSFFAELQYEKQACLPNELVAFNMGDRLLPYLTDINIEELLRV